MKLLGSQGLPKAVTSRGIWEVGSRASQSSWSIGHHLRASQDHLYTTFTVHVTTSTPHVHVHVP